MGNWINNDIISLSHPLEEGKTMSRIDVLIAFQTRNELEPGILSGVANEVKQTVFGDFWFESRDSENDGQHKIAQAVFRSLQAVMSRDWLAVWHMQYGIIDATTFVSNALSALTITETMAKVEALLQELNAAQPNLRYLFRLTPAGRDRDVRSQDEAPTTGGELYIFGVRQGLKYALELLEKVTQGVFETKPDSRMPNLPAGLASFGVFADQQGNFVENELPRLAKVFDDRPKSISVPYR